MRKCKKLLACYFDFYSPEGVTKDKISNITREHKPNLATDQQVRHLKRDGWNLIDLGQGIHSIPDPKKF